MVCPLLGRLVRSSPLFYQLWTGFPVFESYRDPLASMSAGDLEVTDGAAIVSHLYALRALWGFGAARLTPLHPAARLKLAGWRSEPRGAAH